MAAITPTLAEFLPEWLAQQRWYTGQGRTPVLRRVGGLRLPVREEGVSADIHLVVDTSGEEPVAYQVPLTYRREPLEGAEGALVAEVEHTTLGRHHVYDGPHDPALVQALLDVILGEQAVTSPGPAGTGDAQGQRAPGAAGSAQVASASVLTGEQSNTSVIVEQTDGPPLMVKLFRVLHHGTNPDIELQGELAQAGCPLVAQPWGSLRGVWPQRGLDGGRASGDLAFVQEYLPGVEDAWEIALEAARQGADFTESAEGMGRATARLHRDLATALGAAALDEEARAEQGRRLGERLARALPLAEALGEHESAIRSRYEHLADLPEQAWPRAQRIHGDYHLGQVLRAPGRGWVVVDFEGEPLRPLSQRTEPDLALRDVAGMLRSLDYAAGSAELEGAGDRRAWAQAAREAFLRGYAAEAGEEALEPAGLLAALELDKAVYEVVYEAGQRPDWLAIPTAAIARLVGEGSEGGEGSGATAPSPAEPSAEPPAEPSAEPSAESSATPPAVPMTELVPAERAEHVRSGRDRDPHGFLGAHPGEHGVVVRALRPMATAVSVVLPGGARVPLEHGHAGVFAAVLPVHEVPDYRLEVVYEGQAPQLQDDCYRHLPTLGEVDLHLIGEGRHEQLWQVLGSHVRRYDGPAGPVEGTSFAVWAPHAEGVRVIGDFNHWDGVAHPMRALGSTGVWELFIPGVGEGTAYKYEIATRDGRLIGKADPLARRTECPPRTASVVEESHHEWADDAWMAHRAQTDPHTGRMSVYEVHLGSWRQGLGYRELAEQLADYVVEQGFTHVELLPVAEHPYGPSWGYQVSGYYAPTARFGTPDDFRHLVDRLHQAGIGVIVDWVPAHFPKDEFALGRFDGEAVYEHPDPRRGDHPDWGTYIFDYGRPQVRNFLVANAVYWLEEFHIDGLRVDAVASMLYLDYSRRDGEWVPNQYGGRENLEAVQLMQEVNAVCYRRCPGIVTIAEDSTAWPGVTAPTHDGGLGFGLKWNMGWMHDTLDYLKHPPLHRQYHHSQMTFSLMYAFSEAYMLPISHDEVVHGKGSLLRKMPGDRWQQLANVRAFLAYQWAHPGKQLLFMGSEFAQDNEWGDGRSLDWDLLGDRAHAGVQRLVRDLNAVYQSHPALWQLDADPAGFRWIDANDAGGNTFSFVRYPDGATAEGRDASPVVVVVNFSGATRTDVRLGMPAGGRWRELLNTDSLDYGGSGAGNMGVVDATGEPWHGLPHSATLTLPPLGALFLVPDDSDAAAVTPEATEEQAQEAKAAARAVVSQRAAEPSAPAAPPESSGD